MSLRRICALTIARMASKKNKKINHFIHLCFRDCTKLTKHDVSMVNDRVYELHYYFVQLLLKVVHKGINETKRVKI